MRTADRRLCVKADGRTIVPETHPEAHMLIFLPETTVSGKDEGRYDWSEMGPEAAVTVAAIEAPPRTTAVRRAPRRL